MNLYGKSRKDIGDLGEKTVCEYLRRKGFRIIDRNVARKTGELDVIASYKNTLHFVEVKSVLCEEFPGDEKRESFNPADNLHEMKIRKVARTAEWFVAERDWEGDWQIDGALVWFRARDGRALVSYVPQIL